MEPLIASETARISQPKDPLKAAMEPEAAVNQKTSYIDAFTGASSSEITKLPAPVIASYTSHSSKTTVLFNATDYYGEMTKECKFTLVGKFTMGRPQIDTIRLKFLEQIPLKGKLRLKQTPEGRNRKGNKKDNNMEEKEKPGTGKTINKDKDEEVVECLIKTFAPISQQEEDPVSKEINKVVSIQERYWLYFGFDHVAANVNSKIWCFWRSNITCNVISNKKQQLSFKCCKINSTDQFCITVVYAKSKARRRRKLYDDLRLIHNTMDGPWTVLGDFNSILAPEEKKRGILHSFSRSLDFINCLEECDLVDAGYTENTFTWCNGRRMRFRVSKRLDRVLINDKWSDMFHNTRVDHKAKNGSDHSLLLMSVIRQKRKRNMIHKIRNKKGHWVEGNQDISEAAIDHFKDIFSGQNDDNLGNILRWIEPAITEEDNNTLEDTLHQKRLLVAIYFPFSGTSYCHKNMYYDIPTEDEIKQAVFSIDPNSVVGPDVFNDHFYQSTWNTIKGDLCNFVQAYFNGTNLTKFDTHTCLPLIPKVQAPTNFSQMRPISLCRLITENVLLAQEIIHGMKESNKRGNLVIKLDMLVSNNWYSIIINGTRFGFFHSSRGLKQGDPLSPTLFIIAAEVLSRGLNQLNINSNFNGFSMSKNGTQINHVCYADDLILFRSGERKSMRLLMKVLREYQEASGQEINREKTNLYTYGIQSRRRIRKLHRWTGYKHAKLPFTYLGCPIYTGRKTCNLLSDMAIKILNKANGWQVPPVTIMKQIEMYFSNFFWGKKDDKKKYHWSSWYKMSYPYDEGGVGFKKLKEFDELEPSFGARSCYFATANKSIYLDSM
ncbi:uncharacterized protein LOC132612777 [Lycium barbarum]|uniref:uncharacterized protein LOC132612777 n=1 Tax=Lycium barbarum TaxID=112863 RepID=UPI00293E5279|nr:uncharacterized protein LOC132612777 [Lycium barbarum]